MGRSLSAFRRQDIADLKDPSKTYLTRWRIDTRRGSLMLHKINLADADTTLHDHPWVMRSLVLRGGYDEVWAANLADASGLRTAKGVPCIRRHRAGSINKVELGEFHTVSALHRNPTWTLMFIGPEVCGWGYASKGGFVQHDVWHRRMHHV